ncbi:hypothetical protein TNIN_78321 [Trichonephila inaurata madagascariensis]|uniref:Uncharacterized protein n=1 Tax=Trichonephila inaurata madagascariensis TaxID=2747483 RepID=A0A8X6YAF5_9ARAC|nr:hypothetical protein TNIN_78321 [Trichonephila inaurata madagascariensis]
MKKISIISSKNKCNKLDTISFAKMPETEEDIPVLSKYDFYDEELLSKPLKTAKRLKKKSILSIASKSKEVSETYDNSSSQDDLKTNANKKSKKITDLFKKSKKQLNSSLTSAHLQSRSTKPSQGNIENVDEKIAKEESKKENIYKNIVSSNTVTEKRENKKAKRRTMILFNPNDSFHDNEIKNTVNNNNFPMGKENADTAELKSDLKSNVHAKFRRSHLQSPAAKRANLKIFVTDQRSSNDNYRRKEKPKSREHTGAESENAGKDKEHNKVNQVESKQGKGKLPQKENVQMKPEIKIRRSARLAKQPIVNYKQ